MSVLTVDVGGSPITIPCQRGGHAAPRRAGSLPVSFAQQQTSSVRAELMVVPVILSFRTTSEATAIRTLFAKAAQVPCSGDVFNNGSATVTCSADITDEAIQAGTWWELSVTLYEVGTTVGYAGSVTTPIYLGHDPSPVGGDPGILEGSPDQSDISGDGWAFYELFPATSPATCGGSPDPGVTCPTTYSAAAELTWLTDDLAAGWITGAPSAVVASTGGTGDTWATQAAMLKIFVVRSGVDVAQFDTDWTSSNGGFAGGDVTMAGTDPVVFQLLDGDRLRFELWGRMALHGGYSDDSVHQAIGYGHLGGPTYLAIVTLGGLIQKLSP